LEKTPRLTFSSSNKTMAAIFLSYRRADNEAMTGRIADQLSNTFGPDTVFRDIESIDAGQDFAAAIRSAIEQSEVVLVAIGFKWLKEAPTGGSRGIDSPDDFVRLEIEAALRAGKTVMPLLIDGASMPTPDALPESIRRLSEFNATEIRAGADFKSDMARLIEALEANTSALRANSATLHASSAHRHATTPLIVGAVSLVVGVGLLLVMLFQATTLVRLGLTGNVWYVLLLLLGLSASVVIFALFQSYARYKGKALNGTLELGGPTVVMLVVIVLGFYLVPAPARRFDFTVFLHGPAGRQAVVLRDNGKLSLDLGADRRKESVGDKGEVRFVGIPADMRGRKVPMTLEADRFELSDPNLLVPLDDETFYAAVRPKQLKLSGTIVDAFDRPIAQARVRIAAATSSTDQDGQFELVVPADLADSERTVTIVAAGYETWSAQASPGGNPLRVRLAPLTPPR
jgi:hypothetical protein